MKNIKLLAALCFTLISFAVSAQNQKEAYAVLKNGTLTFYYDKNKTFDDFSLNKGEGLPEWRGVFEEENIKKVVFDKSFKDYEPESCYQWFRDCINLEEIQGIENLNTSKITNMEYLFYNCKSLKSIDVSGFSTDNVTNMRYMFYGCKLLTEINVSGFNTAYVDDMTGMFGSCSSLKTLDVSGFKTFRVEKMFDMFYGCQSLTSLDVSGFNTERVKDLTGLFGECSSLISLDVSNFNTENVTKMRWMFYGCSSLTSIDVSGFNTDLVTDMDKIFSGCTSLKTLDLSGFNTNKSQNTLSELISQCDNLDSVYIGFNVTVKDDDLTQFNGKVLFRISLPDGIIPTGEDVTLFKGKYYVTSGGSFSLPEGSYKIPENYSNKCSISGNVVSNVSGSLAIIKEGQTLLPETALSSFPTTYTYNGQNVLDNLNIPSLTINEDYTISPSEAVNAGNYTLIITGKGKYAGELSKHFKINRKDITVKADYKSKEHNQPDPVLTATVSGLVEGDSPDLIKYTITREPGEYIGGYRITCTGDEIQGNYKITGFFDGNFQIQYETPVSDNPKNQSAKVWASSGSIFIESAPDTKYTIIDLNGRIIKTSTTKSTKEEILIKTTGIVIVNINGTSFKISL